MHDLPRSFQLSDESVADLRKEQNKMLERFRSRARLTPFERQVGFGIERERHHDRTGNRDAKAEALAMQGRFAQAADTAVNPKLKSKFQERAEAVACSDADCDCPTYREEGGLRLPNQHVEADVFSIKHGRTMPAIRCRVCGCLNVRPMLPHLAEQREARATSVATGVEVPASDFFRR